MAERVVFEVTHVPSTRNEAEARLSAELRAKHSVGDDKPLAYDNGEVIPLRSFVDAYAAVIQKYGIAAVKDTVWDALN